MLRNSSAVSESLDPQDQLANTSGHRSMLLALMLLFFIMWLVIPLFVPGASKAIYLITLPFRYLGVFVHEMGHGLFTLLSGGQFHWFQMDMNGGVALTSGGFRAATLLGGLLGPALLGAWLLQSSTRALKLGGVFGALIALFVIGIYYMLKPLFLSSDHYPELQNWQLTYLIALVVPGGAGLATLLMQRLGERWQRLYLQVLGILMCYSAFSDWRYILKYDVLNNGLYSDSRVLGSLFWPGGPERLPQFAFVVIAGFVCLANFSLLFWGVHKALKSTRK